MALVKCPECGGSVSSQAPACPHCGYPHPGAAAPGAWSGASPSRGLSPGWLIFGVVAVGMVVLGVLGLGVYRAVQGAARADSPPEELVDWVDPDSVDTVTSRGGPPPPPEDSTFELSAVETQPELLNRDEIAAAISRNYPPLLRDAGVTGSVTLRMRLGSDGVVDAGTIKVVESSHDAFSQAAANVASRLRFRPARVKGKPVPVWVTLPVTFQLQQ
jgi:TonB family protein